jgi:hypothetical protein
LGGRQVAGIGDDEPDPAAERPGVQRSRPSRGDGRRHHEPPEVASGVDCDCDCDVPERFDVLDWFDVLDCFDGETVVVLSDVGVDA